ncbi:hypothetical protein F511_36639 [Dorcoceras hygrometricum]|uniref:Uncharacterized protein n=1 Tax=Dorcoceras hygrometricum TaxID=472368 RepID=A0A2Z7B840_9LAMI|nr:hypothetical protein F511_36639 [Dorcoceras hygrometricum]
MGATKSSHQQYQQHKVSKLNPTGAIQLTEGWELPTRPQSIQNLAAGTQFHRKLRHTAHEDPQRFPKSDLFSPPNWYRNVSPEERFPTELTTTQQASKLNSTKYTSNALRAATETPATLKQLALLRSTQATEPSRTPAV